MAAVPSVTRSFEGEQYNPRFFVVCLVFWTPPSPSDGGVDMFVQGLTATVNYQMRVLSYIWSTINCFECQYDSAEYSVPLNV